MAKRLLDCTASEIAKMSAKEKLDSIIACEGRILCSETIGTTQPLLNDVTNAELAASLGADIVLLNLYDVKNPVINGLKVDDKNETIRTLKKYTGRVIGINLEPVKELDSNNNGMWALSNGRLATVENALIARDQGVDMILLTGNPGNGITNTEIIKAIKEIKDATKDSMIIAAGKMHASGVTGEAGNKILTDEDINEFADAGADIILMPAPGTVPGLSEQSVSTLIECAHKRGCATITAIGTSQEGADTDTIKHIALMSKIAGTDIHHLGDSGYCGMALPENLTAYSMVIRGARHTYRRMALSINR